MTRVLVVACVLAVCGASAVRAQWSYAGELRTDGGALENGTFDVAFELYTQADGGAPQYRNLHAGLIVQDGVVAAQIGDRAVPVDTALLASPELWVQVEIDGTPLLPRMLLTAVPSARVAEVAELATEAEEALTLGGIAPNDVTTWAALAAAGGPAVHFANLTDVPPGWADGDDNTTYDVVPGGGLALTPAGDFGAFSVEAGAVTGAMITDGTLTAREVAGNAVTGALLVDKVVARHVAGPTPISRFALGCVHGGELGPGTVCLQNLEGCPAGKGRPCDTGSGCTAIAFRQFCAATPVGTAVLAP